MSNAKRNERITDSGKRYLPQPGTVAGTYLNGKREKRHEALINRIDSEVSQHSPQCKTGKSTAQNAYHTSSWLGTRVNRYETTCRDN